MLDSHHRSHWTIEDHVTLNETNQKVEVHNKPSCDSEYWSELVTEENKHVVEQVGNWLSVSSMHIDEQSKLSQTMETQNSPYVWKMMRKEPMNPIEPQIKYQR